MLLDMLMTQQGKYCSPQEKLTDETTAFLSEQTVAPVDSRASLSSKYGAQHRCHPEPCQKCRISGSSPGLLNQILHSNKIYSGLEGLLKLERHHTTRNCNRDNTVSSGDGNPVNFRFQSCVLFLLLLCLLSREAEKVWFLAEKQSDFMVRLLTVATMVGYMPPS